MPPESEPMTAREQRKRSFKDLGVLSHELVLGLLGAALCKEHKQRQSDGSHSNCIGFTGPVVTQEPSCLRTSLWIPWKWIPSPASLCTELRVFQCPYICKSTKKKNRELRERDWLYLPYCVTPCVSWRLCCPHHCITHLLLPLYFLGTDSCILKKQDRGRWRERDLGGGWPGQWFWPHSPQIWLDLLTRQRFSGPAWACPQLLGSPGGEALTNYSL